jgi:copper transport protein
VVFALPTLLFAHAHLRRSEPAADARLNTAPTALRLWFTEAPEVTFTRITLRAPDSTEVPLGPVTAVSGDKMGVAVPISAPLAPGTYRVFWRTAAADGHPTSGTFAFTITASATSSAAIADTLPAKRAGGHALVSVDTTRSNPSISAAAATRWLEFVAMLAVVGAVVFRFAVLRGFARVTSGAAPEIQADLIDSARRLGQSALVLLLIATLSRLYAEANALLGPPEQGDHPSWREMLIGTSWGRGWLVGFAGIILAAIGLWAARRSRSGSAWGIAAFGAAAIVIAPALTGHAISTPPVALSVVIDILHVGAVCAWLGALLTLLLSAIPFVRGARARSSLGSGPLVAALVRSFHPIALTCAAIVVATGIIAAWLRLPALSDLWTSTYGRVLLLKLCFVALVIVMGAVNWRRILPALGDEATARRLTRTASAELTMAALVLAVTAVLVSISPP